MANTLMEEHFADITGVKISYAEEGAELPLFVVHGGPGLDHHEFGNFLSPLTDSFRLIYPDVRGCGKSARLPREQYTNAAMIGDLDGLRQHLGLDRIHLLGHSFGGFLALEYALAYPKSLDHLILSSTAPANDFVATTEAKLREAPPKVRAAWEHEAQVASDDDFRETFRGEWDFYFYQPERFRGLRDEYVDRITYGFDCMKAWSELEFPKYDLRPRLGEIRAPTLILAGRYDYVCPLDQSELMAARIPAARLVIFEESAHMNFVEENEKYLSVLRQFLME